MVDKQDATALADKLEKFGVEALITRAEIKTIVAALRATSQTPDAVKQARLSIIAASIGSCTCNCISPNTAFHSAECRYLKLMFALDCLDPQPKSAGE